MRGGEPEAGRVALVTGAAGGVGAAVARAFAAAGVRLALLDISIAGLEASENRLVLPCNVTDEAAVAEAVAAVRAAYGEIHYVVHAAGIVGRGPLADLALEDWRAVMDANLTSAFLLARAVAGDLAASKGALVLLSSTNGRNGGSALSGPAYAAAKAGVINLTRYLAKEWGPAGVRVNCVAPGPVNTPMLDRLSAEERRQLAASAPLGRIAEPEEVAAAIGYLCSPAAATVTGAVLNISGGLVLD